MDLLGDLGTTDQLTSVRAENAVLQDKVKQLTFRVKELSIENESLKAEVEMYRKEAGGTSSTTGTASSGNDSNENETFECSDFLRSGNGVYPQIPDVVLPNLQGIANPLCCALSSDDTILATGGANGILTLCAWGAACDHTRIASTVASALQVQCEGPVIAVAFHPTQKWVAAGCMDGRVWVVTYGTTLGELGVKATTELPTKHAKYVKTVAWSTGTDNLLASASADGTIQIHQVAVTVDYSTEDFTETILLQSMETLHLQTAIESLVFTTPTELCCYARDKPYLQCFDTAKEYQLRKLNLNAGGKPAAAGTTLEDQHVSFAVLDMAVSPNGKYLACATDANRNVILDIDSGLHVRNLYGHSNDAYSTPKIAWSCSGQYILGNTQEEGAVCVWDIASTKLVRKMVEHGQTIRDLYASKTTDTLVTTSFDKQTKVWFAA